MCYDISTNLEAQLSRASRKLDLRAIKEIKENLAPLTDLPIYHSTGFSHPKLLIFFAVCCFVNLFQYSIKISSIQRVLMGGGRKRYIK